MGKRTQLEKTYLRHNVQFIFCELNGAITYSSDTFFEIPRGNLWSETVLVSKIPLVNSADLQYIGEDMYFIRVETQADQILVKLEKIPSSQKALDPKSKIFHIQERINFLNLPASSAKNLLSNYFEEIYNDDELLGTNVPHIPFKLEHIAEALRIVFHDPLAPQSKIIQFQLGFTAKFLVGNRNRLLTELLLKCNELYLNDSLDPIVVVCNFDTEEDDLEVIIKNAGQYADASWQQTVNDLDIFITLPCVVIGSPIAPELVHSVEDDFPYLCDITGGDPDMVIDILQTIIDTLDADIDLLAKAHQKRNWKDLERLPHKMKPNFKSLERDDLSKQLQKMEEFAIARNLKAFDQALDVFLEEATAVTTKLRSYKKA